MLVRLFLVLWSWTSCQQIREELTTSGMDMAEKTVFLQNSDLVRQWLNYHRLGGSQVLFLGLTQ